MTKPTRGSRTRVWVYALILTILLHVATVVGIWISRPFAPAPVEAQPPDPVELVFAPEPQAQPSDDPTQFTELPPDRADEAPEDADLLSNVDSRAQDQVEGGDDDTPQMDGDSEIPQVAMNPSDGALEPPSPEPSPELVEDPDPIDEPREEAQPPSEAIAERAAPLSPEEESPVVKRRSPEPQAELLRPPPGSDIYQSEAENPEGNAGPYGDISLNTWAWDYAPWLQRFKRDFINLWHAPYAYYMGMIHGWTLVEVEIARNGEMRVLNLLGEEGHSSLTAASLAAFRAVAPFRPLPEHFPEETLILKIKLIYPQARRR